MSSCSWALPPVSGPRSHLPQRPGRRRHAASCRKANTLTHTHKQEPGKGSVREEKRSVACFQIWQQMLHQTCDTYIFPSQHPALWLLLRHNRMNGGWRTEIGPGKSQPLENSPLTVSTSRHQVEGRAWLLHLQSSMEEALTLRDTELC